MEALTYTEVRKNFAKAMNSVCRDHSPIIITRQKEKPVVMMSLEDYSSIEETMYLLKSPANAARLAESMKQYKNKQFLKKELIEVEG